MSNMFIIQKIKIKLKYIIIFFKYSLLGDHMKKIIISILLCLISLTINVDEMNQNLNKIIIDPGHGGTDSGASVGDIEEEELNLEISLRLKKIFEDNGYVVDLTRYDNESLCDGKFIKKEDMNKRINKINSNNYIACISIHQNIFSDHQYKGSQVFYYDNEINKKIAENIQFSMNNYLKNSNRKALKKENNYILKRVTIPMVLIECGFMSNEEELNNLRSYEYQVKLAYSIYLGFSKAII